MPPCPTCASASSSTQAIGTFGLMQGKIADMYTALQSSRAFAYQVARDYDAGHKSRIDAASCLLHASEAAVQVALEAHPGARRQRLHQRIPDRPPPARRQALRDRRRHQRDPPHADRARAVRRQQLRRRSRIPAGAASAASPDLLLQERRKPRCIAACATARGFRRSCNGTSSSRGEAAPTVAQRHGLRQCSIRSHNRTVPGLHRAGPNPRRAPCPTSSSSAPSAPPSVPSSASSPASPPRPSAPPRSRPRSSRPASRADQVDEVIMGCVLPAGLGQAPARQASLRRRHSRRRRLHHHQQGLRLGHEGDHARPRPDQGRLGQRRRRRRHGVDDQRAAPAQRLAHRHPLRQRRVRSTTWPGTA